MNALTLGRTRKLIPHRDTWAGWLPPLPWVFAVLQYFRIILPLINSLSCVLLNKVIIMGYDAVEGP